MSCVEKYLADHSMNCVDRTGSPDTEGPSPSSDMVELVMWFQILLMGSTGKDMLCWERLEGGDSPNMKDGLAGDDGADTE